MRSRMILRLDLMLLNRLAFLAPNHFAGVTHAFAFVRLWRVVTPDVSCNLADKVFVDAADADLCILRDGDFDPVGDGKSLMRG